MCIRVGFIQNNLPCQRNWGQCFVCIRMIAAGYELFLCKHQPASEASARSVPGSDSPPQSAAAITSREFTFFSHLPRAYPRAHPAHRAS